MPPKTKKIIVPIPANSAWTHTISKGALKFARDNLRTASLEDRMYAGHLEFVKAKRIQAGIALRKATRDLKRLEEAKEKNA